MPYAFIYTQIASNKSEGTPRYQKLGIICTERFFKDAIPQLTFVYITSDVALVSFDAPSLVDFFNNAFGYKVVEVKGSWLPKQKYYCGITLELKLGFHPQVLLLASILKPNQLFPKYQVRYVALADMKPAILVKFTY